MDQPEHDAHTSVVATLQVLAAEETARFLRERDVAAMIDPVQLRDVAAQRAPDQAYVDVVVPTLELPRAEQLLRERHGAEGDATEAEILAAFEDGWEDRLVERTHLGHREPAHATMARRHRTVEQSALLALLPAALTFTVFGAPLGLSSWLVFGALAMLLLRRQAR